jgi:hypothetical protein
MRKSITLFHLPLLFIFSSAHGDPLILAFDLSPGVGDICLKMALLRNWRGTRGKKKAAPLSMEVG